MPLRPRIPALPAAAPFTRVTLWLPLAVLLVGLACALALAGFVQRQLQRDQRAEFELLVGRISDALHHRLQGAAVALRGGLWPFSAGIDGATFAAQAQQLVESGDYPGLRALALARIVSHEATPASPFANPVFELTWSAPEHSVARPGTRLGSDPAFASAMDQALLSGQATLLPQPGVRRAMLLLALYRPGGGTDTESQRVQAAIGLLVATVDIERALGTVGAAAEAQVDFELFDGAGAELARLLYDDDDHLASHDKVSDADLAGRRFAVEQRLLVAGRVLTLRASTTPHFDARRGLGAALPAGTLAAGSVLSLLAALLVRLLAQGRERARALARSMTADLERMSAEQQAALQSLARQQAHLQAVIAGARCGVLVWHLPSDEVTLDVRLAQLLGYARDELQPMTLQRWTALMHPADLPAARRVTQDLIRGQRALAESDVRMRHKDGRWCWTQVRCSITERDAAGRAVCFAAIYLEIDERKQAAERWQLRATLSSDWYWQSDAEHRVEDVTGGPGPGVLALPAEYLGKRRDQIAWFEPPAGGWAAHHAMLDRHEPFKGVVYRSHSTGGDRWIEIDGQPRFDDDGGFLGYAGVGRDITERLRVTEQLRQSLAVQDALLSSLTIPVVMKDREGVIQRVNPAYAQEVGLTVAEVLGRRTGSILGPESGARHEAEDRSVIESGQPVHYEMHQRYPDGRELDLLVYKAPVIGADGRVVGIVGTSVDITERRRTERALESERARLADIIAGANAGIVEWNLVDGTLRVDERYAAMLGETPEVLHMQTREAWEQRLHPEDRAPFASAVQEHIEGISASVALDARLRHSHGNWVWVHIRGRVTQRSADGRALSFTGANFDVTERRVAAERWRSRAELSGDWFWQTDAEHRFMDMVSGDTVRALTRGPDLLGRRRDEVPWLDAPEQGWPAFHAMLDRHEPFKGVVYRNRTFAEDPRWIEIDGRPRHDETGRFVGYDGVGRDVTERRRVTEKLRDSLAQLDSLIRAVPIPLVMKDREGRNFRVNDAYCSFYGVTEAQVIGRTVFDFWEPEVAARYHAEDMALMADRRTRSTPVQVRTSTGQRLDILVHKSPITAPDGEVIGTVGAVVDMSEQQAAARALLDAKEAAESANRAKSAFLATMSHEIRTPMNGVIGMAELLAYTALTEDQARQVRTIVESARSLLDILDDILDFSKIEAGRLELETQEVALAPLVESACDALVPLAIAGGVRLHVHVDAGLPARVQADATRLRQIVTNLLGNAIKFGASRGEGRSGHVSVRVLREPARTPVEGQAQGQAGDGSDELVLRVADDGIGMDEMTLARLFVPFSQGEISTTRRFGGTGLGLAIIHRLVEVMQGQIEVTSEPGRGSVFTVRLPLRAADAAAAPGGRVLDGVRCVIAPELLDHRSGAPLPVPPAADIATWLRDAGAVVSIENLVTAATAAGDAVLLYPAPPMGSEPAPGGVPPAATTVSGALASILDSGAKPLLLVGDGRAGEVRPLGPTLARIDQPRRATLVRAVAVLAGRASPSQLALAEPASTTGSPAAAGMAPHEAAAVTGRAGDAAAHEALLPSAIVFPSSASAPLILVAEDDATNRLVIERQLELLGLRVELAPDGAQALERWRHGLAESEPPARAGSGRHAALLTDLHMPGMDGYQLAQSVRRDEQSAGRTRIPIIALTANALKGEALRARAAGIDDYLTKPVPLQMLRATLLHWLPLPRVDGATVALIHPAGPGGPASASPGGDGAAEQPGLTMAAPNSAGAVALALWNPAVPRTLIGDDAQGVAELVQDFLAMADEHAVEIRAALERRDGVRAAALAHRLKSAAMAVGAEALAAECAELERCGTARDPERFALRLAAFDTVFGDTRLLLATTVQSQPALARP